MLGVRIAAVLEKYTKDQQICDIKNLHSKNNCNCIQIILFNTMPHNIKLLPVTSCNETFVEFDWVYSRR